MWSVVVWMLVMVLTLGVLEGCSCDIFDVGDVLRGGGRVLSKRTRRDREAREACCLMF